MDFTISMTLFFSLTKFFLFLRMYEYLRSSTIHLQEHGQIIRTPIHSIVCAVSSKNKVFVTIVGILFKSNANLRSIEYQGLN